MRIGIDLDDVLNDLNEKWIAKHNLINNENASIEDIKSWGICSYVSVKEEIYSYIDNDLLKTLEPKPYSIQMTEKLLRDGHELYIVTATDPSHAEVKYEWVRNYYPHIPKDNFMIVNAKHLVNVDILIDDAPHNIAKFPKDTIIFSRPWNEFMLGNRANNWIEVYNMILDTEEEKSDEDIRGAKEV